VASGALLGLASEDRIEALAHQVDRMRPNPIRPSQRLRGIILVSSAERLERAA
jgi:hypothetical protein